GPQGGLLLRVLDPDSEPGSVAEIRLDQVGQESRAEDQIGKTEMGESANADLQDGIVAEGEERLGQDRRVRRQASSSASGEKNGPHRVYSAGLNRLRFRRIHSIDRSSLSEK